MRDHQSRLFQAREARYADRLAAVVEFIAAANDETDAVAQFERDPQHGELAPFDLHDDYVFSKLNAAHARLSVLASPAVTTAADDLREAVYDCFMGKKDRWATYRQALVAFQVRAREMLAEDMEDAPPSPGARASTADAGA